MLTIYHNSRCRKSREGLQILEKSGKEFKIREYLKVPMSEEEIGKLLLKLKISPLKLVRQNEKSWKDNYKGKVLSDEEIIKAMAEHPSLIERPIVETKDSAVIGRPSAQIEKII